MEITQLLKPPAAQYATFVEKGFSLDLDFLNAYYPNKADFEI